jgi:hypothetical protein
MAQLIHSIDSSTHTPQNNTMRFQDHTIPPSHDAQSWPQQQNSNILNTALPHIRVDKPFASTPNNDDLHLCFQRYCSTHQPAHHTRTHSRPPIPRQQEKAILNLRKVKHHIIALDHSTSLQEYPSSPTRLPLPRIYTISFPRKPGEPFPLISSSKRYANV